jgi:hypothetical protein
MSLGREFIALPPPMARASAAPGLGELRRGAALAAIAVIAITLRILRGRPN